MGKNGQTSLLGKENVIQVLIIFIMFNDKFQGMEKMRKKDNELEGIILEPSNDIILNTAFNLSESTDQFSFKVSDDQIVHLNESASQNSETDNSYDNF